MSDGLGIFIIKIKTGELVLVEEDELVKCLIDNRFTLFGMTTATILAFRKEFLKRMIKPSELTPQQVEEFFAKGSPINTIADKRMKREVGNDFEDFV